MNMDGLRERLPHRPESPVKAENADVAQEAVQVLNEQEAGQEKDEKDKKTYGRTPDGTGAYTTIPSLCGSRAPTVWDSKYTIESKEMPARTESSRLSHFSRQLTMLMP